MLLCYQARWERIVICSNIPDFITYFLYSQSLCQYMSLCSQPTECFGSEISMVTQSPFLIQCLLSLHSSPFSRLWSLSLHPPLQASSSFTPHPHLLISYWSPLVSNKCCAHKRIRALKNASLLVHVRRLFYKMKKQLAYEAHPK